MGQYYYTVNLDKKEYLHPHMCGDGLKLMEFGLNSCGTMSCLAILLADGNGRGGGDLNSTNPIVGSWAGDRIVITGDYADPGQFGIPDTTNLMSAIDAEDSGWTNISKEAMEALKDDEWAAERTRDRWGGEPSQKPKTDHEARIRRKLKSRIAIDDIDVKDALVGVLGALDRLAQTLDEQGRLSNQLSLAEAVLTIDTENVLNTSQSKGTP